jgi:hypothetical protein
MAVRAGAYQKQGGMNKRQAGEDFYFLHKIIPLGGFTNLNTTRVIPSPRASDRVPFGTGRAVGTYLAGEPLSTYPLAAFRDLEVLFASVDRLTGDADCTARKGFRDGGTFLRGAGESFSPALREFLDKEDFDQALAEMTSNSASRGAFRKRFNAWFDGFRTMKFVHHARDYFYGPGRIEQEPAGLLAWRGVPLRGAPSLRQLLQRFRELDRGDRASY